MVGVFVVSVLSAKQTYACFARSWGRKHVSRRKVCHVSSVPSSAHAICLGNCCGSEKGRRDVANGDVLRCAIMHPPLEFVMGFGSRASEGKLSSLSGVLIVY
jgi:hypothetical protein